MLTPAATITEAPLPELQSQRPADARRRWFELSLVLLLSFGATILHSVYLLKNGPGAMPRLSGYNWSGAIVQELGALLLLGYVLSRRNQRFRNLGLLWSLRDVGTGLLVAVGSYFVYALGYLAVRGIHLAILGTAPAGPSPNDFFGHPSLVIIPFSVLNPFFEELIVRAYLMTEVIDLSGSRALAIALSVAVQFSYHLYYGWEGALALSFPFLALSIYYARSRRALPIIVAHGFFDIAALFRLW